MHETTETEPAESLRQKPPSPHIPGMRSRAAAGSSAGVRTEAARDAYLGMRDEAVFGIVGPGRPADAYQGMPETTNSDGAAAVVAPPPAYPFMADTKKALPATGQRRRGPHICSVSSTDFETTLRALIGDFVHDAIRRELSRVGGTATGAVYSTEPSAWPPGARSRRSARDRIRAVPGHAGTGKGKATVWSVSADAYRAHHGRRVERVTQSSATDQELADAALAASGLRPTTRKACAR